MNRRALKLPAGIVVAGALALGGCGGGDDDSSSTAASADTTSPATSPAGTGRPQEAEKSTDDASGRSYRLGSPADVPRSEGGDNSIQDFGSEAAQDERAAAARALAAYYRALSTGDTEAACAMLSSGAREGIENTLKQLGGQGSSQVPSTCPQALKLTGGDGKSPERQLSELLSLRQQDDHAFLIYRAGDGKVYAMPMAQEDGEWKVAGVSAGPLVD
jgi:hypothetical protein